jgi:tRNA(fMet)-specific endonuclease VapC
MKTFMLDTNTVSYLIRGQAKATQRVIGVPMSSLRISSITEGELQFGLAKRPEAIKLHLAVKEFLMRVDVLPWDRSAAQTYGLVRASLEKKGKPLGLLDTLIAAHALSNKAVLVSSDSAFQQVDGLATEDWSI